MKKDLLKDLWKEKDTARPNLVIMSRKQFEYWAPRIKRMEHINQSQIEKEKDS